MERRRRTESGGTFEYRVVNPVPKSQCPRCREYVDDYDGFGVLAHMQSQGGCGYCSHPGYTDGLCTICGKPEQHEQMELGL